MNLNIVLKRPELVAEAHARWAAQNAGFDCDVRFDRWLPEVKAYGLRAEIGDDGTLCAEMARRYCQFVSHNSDIVDADLMDEEAAWEWEYTARAGPRTAKCSARCAWCRGVSPLSELPSFLDDDDGSEYWKAEGYEPCDWEPMRPDPPECFD